MFGKNCICDIPVDGFTEMTSHKMAAQVIGIKPFAETLKIKIGIKICF